MRFDKSKGSPEPVLALDRMPERENNDPLVDLRIVAPHLKIVRPQTIPWCRKRVAEMAGEAALRLPKGFILGITDAWRPIERQRRIYDFMWNCALEAFPGRDFASLRRTVNRWVAPPYRKAPPGHCTGAALDVHLLDAEGEVVDVSAPYDRFGAAPTYAFGLTPEAHEKRMILVNAMLSAGFSNCRDEWWHYSYGDAGWAVRVGRPYCIYGLIHLEPEHFVEQEILAEEAMKERTNPFIPRQENRK
jgi:D-alanyl-D-alanine dipeptidase